MWGSNSNRKKVVIKTNVLILMGAAYLVLCSKNKLTYSIG